MPTDMNDPLRLNLIEQAQARQVSPENALNTYDQFKAHFERVNSVCKHAFAILPKDSPEYKVWQQYSKDMAQLENKVLKNLSNKLNPSYHIAAETKVSDHLKAIQAIEDRKNMALDMLALEKLDGGRPGPEFIEKSQKMIEELKALEKKPEKPASQSKTANIHKKPNLAETLDKIQSNVDTVDKNVDSAKALPSQVNALSPTPSTPAPSPKGYLVKKEEPKYSSNLTKGLGLSEDMMVMQALDQIGKCIGGLFNLVAMGVVASTPAVKKIVSATKTIAKEVCEIGGKIGKKVVNAMAGAASKILESKDDSKLNEKSDMENTSSISRRHR
ncbi:MAG: hypothetical protein HKM04_01550 [Legionellales bacterium]|nr:hypothetical protein [Legionellales bacterium]